MPLLKTKLPIYVLTIVSIALASLVAIPLAANASPGDSFEEAIGISTCEELEDIGTDAGTSSLFYELTADINCAGSETWNEGEGFQPIGDNSTFTGGIRGNGYEISNVTIYLDDYGVGLFAETNGAVIENLDVNDIYVDATSSSEYVGGLIGECDSTTVSDSSITGYVEGAYGVGGMAGDVDTCTFNNSDANVEVVSEDSYVGGFVGASNNGTYYNSQAFGDVTGDGDVGGFGGEFTWNEITDCYSTGNVTSTDNNAGGFIGLYSGGEILRSFSTGDVSAEGQLSVGGFIGFVVNANIDESFSEGDALGGGNVGGFIGNASANINNVYSRGNATATDLAAGFIAISENTSISRAYATGLAEASEGSDEAFIFTNFGGSEDSSFFDGELNGVQINTQSDATSKTTAEMKDIATFTDLNTVGLNNPWDFPGTENDDSNDYDIWVIDDLNDGYPRFAWLELEEDTLDNDNISDEEEAGAPNGGDGNNDGLPDNDQSYVASLVNPINGKYVTLALPDEDCSIESVQVVSEDTGASDVAFDYPFGLLDFTFECIDDLTSVTVTVIFHGIENGDYVLRKFNPNTAAYTTLNPLTLGVSNFGESAVIFAQYVLVDGGPLDIDGEVNGRFVDPVGLGTSAVGAPRTGGGGTAVK